MVLRRKRIREKGSISKIRHLELAKGKCYTCEVPLLFKYVCIEFSPYVAIPINPIIKPIECYLYGSDMHKLK